MYTCELVGVHGPTCECVRCVDTPALCWPQVQGRMGRRGRNLWEARGPGNARFASRQPLPWTGRHQSRGGRSLRGHGSGLRPRPCPPGSRLVALHHRRASDFPGGLLPAPLLLTITWPAPVQPRPRGLCTTPQGLGCRNSRTSGPQAQATCPPPASGHRCQTSGPREMRRSRKTSLGGLCPASWVCSGGEGSMREPHPP